LYLLIVFVLIIYSKPYWINNPPTEKYYLYFIGVAETDKPSSKTRREAFLNAFEKVKSYFKKDVKRQDLYIVKEYYDKKEKKLYLLTKYSIYEHFKRLSEKELLRRERKREIEEKKRRAMRKKERGEIVEALKIYNELQVMDIKDEEILSEIDSGIKEIISGIRFKVYPYKSFVTIKEEKPIEFRLKIFYEDEMYPVKGSKLKVSFVKGSGWLENTTYTTDKKGEVLVRILRFNSPGENILKLKLEDIPEAFGEISKEIKFSVTGERIVLTKKVYSLNKGERKQDYFLLLEEGTPLGTLRFEANLGLTLSMGFTLYSESAEMYEVTERVEVRGIEIKEKKEESLKIKPEEGLEKKEFNLEIPPLLIKVEIEDYKVSKVRYPGRGEILIFDNVTFLISLHYL